MATRLIEPEAWSQVEIEGLQLPSESLAPGPISFFMPRLRGARLLLEDRYHAHVLRTPAEVRNAVRYVLGNFDSHAARRGERVSSKPRIDPFSSASGKQPRNEQPALFPEPAASDASGWLLRNAERLRPGGPPA